jgi:hypothetical protein
MPNHSSNLQASFSIRFFEVLTDESSASEALNQGLNRSSLPPGSSIFLSCFGNLFYVILGLLKAGYVTDSRGIRRHYGGDAVSQVRHS